MSRKCSVKYIFFIENVLLSYRLITVNMANLIDVSDVSRRKGFPDADFSSPCFPLRSVCCVTGVHRKPLRTDAYDQIM